MSEPILGTCHSKLNWWLCVGPSRGDGYHELETVYQELDFAEQVTISKANDDECILTGFPEDIPAESNLVARAWRLMKNAFPEDVLGIHFSIIKTLPHGGGIGGGSSNAAWTISSINQLYQLDAPRHLLRKIAGELGSDVSFFLDGGTAIGRGRGELLETIAPCPEYWLVLMMPHERMSTVEGYRALDSIRASSGSSSAKTHTLSQFLTILYSGDPEELAAAIHNDFDHVAEKHQWFHTCKKKLSEAGALRIFLCGSGSTVAGLVKDKAAALRIAEAVGGIPTSNRS